MDLNYSAIFNSSMYAKCRKLIDVTGNQKLKFVFMFFGGIFLFFGVMFGLSYVSPLFVPVMIMSVFIVLFVGLYKLITKGAKDWKIIQKDLSEFAKQNSFEYKEIPFVQVTGKELPDINLTLPFKAKLESNSGYMKGSFKNLPFDYISGSLVLTDYRGFSAQSGSDETRSITALHITLPLSLPKLYIDTKRNNVSGFEAKANNIEELQQYSLEGDFPTYYRVFAEKDDQINVLSILTPEVMQKLLENKYYDVWIDGNKLVVFALASSSEYFAGIPMVFPMAEMLINEIDKIARSQRR